MTTIQPLGINDSTYNGVHTKQQSAASRATEEIKGQTAALKQKTAGAWDKHAPDSLKRTAKWMGSPLAGTEENPNVIGRNLNKAQKYFDGVATKEMDKGIKVAKEASKTLGKEAVEEGAKTEIKVGLKGTIARHASKFLGGVARTAKAVPILGAVIESAMQIPDVIEGFKEGRGLAQLAKSATMVGGSTLGALALAAMATNPLGLAGMGLAVVGGIAGTWVADKVGSGLFGSNKGEEALAEAPVGQNPEIPAFGKQTQRHPYSNSSQIQPFIPRFPV